MPPSEKDLIESMAYRLYDFGHGQKLESFGSTLVLRDTPSVPQSNRGFGGSCRSRRELGEIDLIYRDHSAIADRASGIDAMPPQALTNRGHWIGKAPEPWMMSIGRWSMLLKPTPAGQVGVFPEQVVNWQWVLKQGADLCGMRALNLFAYTGSMTLALLLCGASVTHVDSAANTIKWARQNAEISSLANAPVRWICEHATKFVQREILRGSKYDILIADPPSFGKGPKGQQWQIQRHFEPLIRDLSKLCDGRPQRLIISCHTPGIDHRDLFQMASRHFVFDRGIPESFPLDLISSAGKVLNCGHCFRFSTQKQVPSER